MKSNETTPSGGNTRAVEPTEAANPSGAASPLPSIGLPKGGGAIRGIGEKFAANPVTGTGSLSVPIYASPGRSGFGPQLSLSYDSGASNGPFGSASDVAGVATTAYLIAGGDDCHSSARFFQCGND